MGQQQLLLVILVTILVGIATVVALNVFGTAADDANRDAVRQDILQGASQAQAIFARPEMLDGAGGDFTNLQDAAAESDELIRRLGMAISTRDNCGTEGSLGNENGCYEATVDGQYTITITGVPASGTENIVATVRAPDAVDPDDSDEVVGSWDVSWDED